MIRGQTYRYDGEFKTKTRAFQFARREKKL